MFLTTIVLVVLAAGLMVTNGLRSSKLVANKLIRRLVVVGSIVAAVLAGFLIVETLQPAAPTGEGELKKDGDVIALGNAKGGVLSLECKRLEGVKKTGVSLTLRMVAEGKDAKQNIQATFQVGDWHKDLDTAKIADMGTNIPLNALGEGARLTLTKISDDSLASVHAAYHPYRFPFYPAFIALLVLVVLAAAYEGALPSGWQRTFLTVTFSGVAALVWLFETGLTVDDAVWTLWIRFAYAIVIGAVAGTVLPMITGKFLPELQGPPRKGDEPAPFVDETPSD